MGSISDKETDDLKENGGNRKLYIAAAAVLAACIAGLAVIVFVEGPGIITARVTGLELSQEGAELQASWRDMECEGYLVTVTSEGKTLASASVDRAGYTLKGAVPGKRYEFSVCAKMKSGYDSKDAEAQITAKKFKQKLKLDMDRFDGFKSDKFTLSAQAEGRMEFSSSDERVAAVDDEGRVSLLRPGRAEIRVSLPESGIYRAASRKVRVNVYPESLDKTELNIGKTSDTSVELNWKEIEFAGGYSLLKLNPATGKYYEVKRIDNGDTSVEIARNSGSYRVRAYASVRGKTIGSEASEPVRVRSAAADARSYSSLTTIETIDSSDVRVLTYLTGNRSTKNPQSMCFTGKNYVVAFSSRSNRGGRLEAYNEAGEQTAAVNTDAISHANGCTYNKNTGKIYIMKTYAGRKIKEIQTFDGETLKQGGAIRTVRAPSGIAYDISNDKYYMSAGPRLYVTDGDMGLEKTIIRKRTHNSQDMGAHNGVALSCIWTGGNSSYIDMYRADDGAYIGSYSVPLGEIESVVVRDGHFVILVNVIGSSRDAIYVTKNRMRMP